MTDFQADVCVVGSGAGGATAFDYLASSGIKVLLLEQGPQLLEEQMPKDIAARTAVSYRHGGLQAILGNTPIPFGEGCVLGGSTEVNGGLFWPPPASVLTEWRKIGFHPQLSDQSLADYWERLARDLQVGHFPVHSPTTDSDSELMRRGFQANGHTTTPALRAAPQCERSNLCPSICPTGAKKSMSQTLIPRGLASGGRVVTDTEVIAISAMKNGLRSVTCRTRDEVFTVQCKSLLLAAGALRSPGLLGSVTGQRIFPLGLHLNAKVIARFPEPINSERSTIFTLQAQDWLDEGYIAMPANLRPEYLAMGLTAASNTKALELLKSIEALGLYTVQIRPQHLGRVARVGRTTTQPFWWTSRSDTDLATKGIMHLARALFSVGADEVLLPIKGLPSATNLFECEALLQQAKPSNWIFTSVHAMSTLPMGHTSRYCNAAGQARELQGMWIVDASALPTTVGESPQGSIMLHSLATAMSAASTI